MRTARLIVAGVLTVTVALTGAVTASASPAAVVKFRAATTTPAVDAETGTAVFVASGMPAGTGTLQWFKDNEAWVNVARVVRKGAKGTARYGALPAGLNKFRILTTRSGKLTGKSSIVTIPTRAWFTRDAGDMTGFGGIAMPGDDFTRNVNGSLSKEDLCDTVTVGIADQTSQKGLDPGWAVTATVFSEVLPPPVLTANAAAPNVVMTVPVSGDIAVEVKPSYDFSALSDIRTGMRAHCVFEPVGWS